MNTLDSYSLLTISKYFKSINDYINVSKTCKEYQNIIPSFHYNPIPMKKEYFKIFENIERLIVYYDSESNQLELADNDKIKKVETFKISTEFYEYYNKPIVFHVEVPDIYLNDSSNMHEYRQIMIQTNNIDDLNIKNISSLYNNSFYSFRLDKLVLPNNLSYIGYCCFNYCPYLTELIINANLKKIDQFSFERLPRLKELIIPNSLTEIRERVFENLDSCTKIIVGKDLNYSIINRFNFYHHPNLKESNLRTEYFETESNIINRISSYSYSNSRTIPADTFKKFNYLTKLDISNLLIDTIQFNSFQECLNLKDLYLPTTLTYIGSNCFSVCFNLTKLDISNLSIEAIHCNTFTECSNLKDLYLPTTLTYIGWNCFSNCFNLTNLIGIENCKTIRKNCFLTCQNLNNAIIFSPDLMLIEDSFINLTKIDMLMIPIGSMITMKSFQHVRNKIEWIDFGDDVYSDVEVKERNEIYDENEWNDWIKFNRTINL